MAKDETHTGFERLSGPSLRRRHEWPPVRADVVAALNDKEYHWVRTYPLMAEPEFHPERIGPNMCANRLEMDLGDFSTGPGVRNLELSGKLHPRPFLTRLRWKGRRLANLVRGRRSVHFLHIGKTGGSAVKHAIRQNPVDPHFEIHLHPHSFRLRDVPKGDKVFFFVRDPLSRFVSGFLSRQRKGRPAHFYEWSDGERVAFDEFDTPNELALALSSSDSARKLRAERAMTEISHVRASYWDWFENERYFRSRMPDILFIGFQERLADDFETLKSKIGLAGDVRLPDDDRLAHRGPVQIERTLDDEAVANLQAWYVADFRFVEICQRLVEERTFD